MDLRLLIYGHFYYDCLERNWIMKLRILFICCVPRIECHVLKNLKSHMAQMARAKKRRIGETVLPRLCRAWRRYETDMNGMIKGVWQWKMNLFLATTKKNWELSRFGTNISLRHDMHGNICAICDYLSSNTRNLFFSNWGRPYDLNRNKWKNGKQKTHRKI